MCEKNTSTTATDYWEDKRDPEKKARNGHLDT